MNVNLFLTHHNHVCLLVWLVILVACSPPPDVPLPPSVEIAHSNYGLVGLELRIDRKILKVGDMAQIRFTITNDAKDARIFESTDTPVMDIVIKNRPGTKILSAWSNQNADKVKHYLKLKPGESIILDMSWLVLPDQEVGPISVGGLLYQDSKLVAGAPGTICIELCR